MAFDDKLWLIGGEQFGAGPRFNDVWWSSDGSNWTQSTAAAGWDKRCGHTSVVYDGKMWVLGGYNDSFVRLGDMWIQATAAAGWGGREGLAAVSYNGKIWIMLLAF